MKLEIKELNKRDYKKAIQFAITGMHFNWYTDSKLQLSLYGRYFLYLELSCATQIIAAYKGSQLAGLLLARINGEPVKRPSLFMRLYVRLFDILQNIFVKGGTDIYDAANKELLKKYCQTVSPDGELLFLVANPKIMSKGVGSFLLEEFERRTKGKNIYLYTDDACTYQFYEHKNFICSGKKEIILSIGRKRVPLQCLLYSKHIS